MTLLNILEYPDPRLRIKAKPVTVFDDQLQQIINDMFETMYDTESGIGLAAIQVHIDQSIVVIDVERSGGKKNPLTLINPEIIAHEGSVASPEGCLSVPGAYEDVKRYEKVTVNNTDQEGKEYQFEADGFLSCVIQHETDHLNGKLFIDRLSSIKRDRVRKKLLEISKHRM